MPFFLSRKQVAWELRAAKIFGSMLKQSQERLPQRLVAIIVVELSGLGLFRVESLGFRVILALGFRV